MFAKLYETRLGQILAKIDEEDGVPVIQISFQPEGLGVCNTSLIYKEDAWDIVDKAFEELSKQDLINIVQPIMDELKNSFK